MSMSEKSPDAFRTISEVAEDLDLPQHVLRFWETRFTQIKPLKRGGGRRYYRPDDVELLRGIRHLLYGEGYTIKGVQRILKEQGPRFVMQIWREDAIPLAAASRMDDMDGEEAADVPAPPQRKPQVVMQEPEPPVIRAACQARFCRVAFWRKMIRARTPDRARASALWSASCLTAMKRRAFPRTMCAVCRRLCSSFWSASACWIRRDRTLDVPKGAGRTRPAQGAHSVCLSSALPHAIT